MTTTEEMLRQALQARADLTTYEPTPVFEVARRARVLRRKRVRTTVVVAAAALAAVAVPAGLVLDPGDPERTPAPAGPTVTIDSLSDLPSGASPTVDYLLGRTYVYADGRRVELDITPGSARDAAPYRDGLLVTASSPTAIADHLWFARDGRRERTGCGGEEVALSGDGRLFAYARTVRDCNSWGRQPVIQWGRTETMLGDPVYLDAAASQRVEPVGVSVDRVLYNEIDATGDRPPTVYTTDKTGSPVEVEGIARAAAWDPETGQVAGCPAEGRCVVVDEQDGTVRLTLDPGEEPLSFSPDGRYLATAEAGGDRFTAVTVRDARTGDVVVVLASDAAAFQGADSLAWETSDRLLVAVLEGDGEGLVRLGTDGRVERATAVTEPVTGGFLLPGA